MLITPWNHHPWAHQCMLSTQYLIIHPRSLPQFQIMSITLGITRIMAGITESWKESQEIYLRIIIILKYKSNEFL